MRLFTTLISISTCIILTQKVSAQDAGDFVATTLELSTTSPGGSARILGLGEAQTALGGDISSISSNPAGLGFFNRSEFSFSPTFNYVNTSSEYQGLTTTDGRLNFNFGNLGAVIKSAKESGKFKGGSFGISINRVADFQNQVSYEGSSSNQTDNGNIIFDENHPADFVEYAVLSSTVNNSGEINFNNDFAELAYNTFLISAFDVGNGQYIVDRDFYAVDNSGNLITDGNGNLVPAYSEPDFPVLQSESIKSTGAAYQTSIAYGANYDDRLYFGGNIGILSLTKKVERTYQESPTNADLNNLILEDNYELNGTGVLASIGIIGRPISTLLVGLSYSTPSFYSIEQIRSITLTANYAGNAQESSGFDYEPFNYVVTTPSKLRLGLTYFFGKFGFITGDVEQVNYGGAKLSSPESGISFSEDNRVIERFDMVRNYRLGTEFRYDIFRFRGGVSYMADPLKNHYDQSQVKISLGGGIRTEDYFVDMAVISSNGRKSTVSPYPSQQAIVDNKNTRVSFTVGFFF